MNADTPLFDRVQAVLAEALQVEPEMVTPGLVFGDLPQWDSLGHMEVMMRLEEVFGIDITADSIAELTSVKVICEHLSSNGSK